MSDGTSTTWWASRRFRWVAGVSAVVIVVALVIWGITAASSSGDPEAVPSPSRSGSADPSASASPDDTPSASPTPEPDPTEIDDPVPRPTKDPVDLVDTATPAAGLTANLVSIEAVAGEVTIPGEVAGPALRITLAVVNDTDSAFATPAVVVNLYMGEDLTPAGPLLKPGGKEFPQSVAAGESAEGVYVFNVPIDQRDDITIEVDLAVGTPVVVFHGAV